MRIALLLVVLAVAPLSACASRPPVQGPWCAVVDEGAGNVTWNCHYGSIEACRGDVVAGNKGICNRNPRWKGHAGGRR